LRRYYCKRVKGFAAALKSLICTWK